MSVDCVERPPCGIARQRCLVVVEERTVGGTALALFKKTALDERGKRGIEKDDQRAMGTGQRLPITRQIDSCPAGRDDCVRLQEAGGECLRFEVAKGGFAEGGEEVSRTGAGSVFDASINIEKKPTELCGKQSANGGLSGAHESGEDDAAKGAAAR